MPRDHTPDHVRRLHTTALTTTARPAMEYSHDAEATGSSTPRLRAMTNVLRHHWPVFVQQQRINRLSLAPLFQQLLAR
ncbi:hypothetical protein [Pseudomonas huanghezhanensis]|uniref:hypothetical protein n=1 Tax=Pseudomonas huanghezhanensis TaxID=3002903 RepID=UPI002286BCAB|nr:hypothetical protein [Pseudomonas sp. BSw22131]